MYSGELADVRNIIDDCEKLNSNLYSENKYKSYLKYLPIQKKITMETITIVDSLF